jgi:hypothetical protein
VVWDVRDVEKLFRFIRPANIRGLVGKKIFQVGGLGRSGG